MQVFNTIGSINHYVPRKKTYGPPVKPATPVTINGTPPNTTNATVTYNATTYRCYLIDTSGNFTIGNVPDGFRINVFAIGGGGAGGSSNYGAGKYPGGGGAGQIIQETYFIPVTTTITMNIKIGSGGKSITESNRIGTQNGGNTTITSTSVNILSIGGESGAMYRLSNGAADVLPANNRSGGKSGGSVYVGGLSNLSVDDSANYAGAGGGGSSSNGTSTTNNNGGQGGNAILPNASLGFPQNKYYGAGGGGMGIGSGGSGGKGANATDTVGGTGAKNVPAVSYTPPVAPVAKSGSGGGGTINGGSLLADGASGAVLISIDNIYLIP